MKLNELLLARKVIVSKSQTQVPARLAYKMMKFIKGTEDEENFYNEKLRAIIEEYGARDKEGKLEGESGGVKIRPDALSACKSAIKELDGTQIDAPQITFNLDEIEPLTLSAKEMLALEYFVKED